ncbi:protocadherin Fat 2 [Syngnathoides biaculeatus]|uniref:protocadherin Fat 2 n=1 Tax=Syngnathoides biaculeatus TaxID=300417 RepID=UPI002ADE6B51|nr:protocadherin Fat 2 [Syngnathoides biaculeatus]XP_061690532.1 protocadherin Fat 2 [Syngnathoides biaculeatus]
MAPPLSLPASLILAAVLLNAARCEGTTAELKTGSPLRFTHLLYNASIDENSGTGSYVETPVKMGVAMADAFWEIRYAVVSGDDGGFFQAEDFKVGDFCFLRIKTQHAALLNREVRDTYALTVEATENTQELQAKTKVLVQILDTNDLKPLFDPSSYTVAIKEDTPLQSSLVRVSAADADMGSNAEFYYSFTVRSHPFVVDPFSGTISLLKKLNHTRSDRYELTVLAEDRTKRISGVQKFGNVAKVSVKVQKASAASPAIELPSEPTVSVDGTVTIGVHVEAGLKPVGSLRVLAGDPHKYFEVIPEGSQGCDFQVVSTKKIIWSQNPFGLNLSLQAQDISSPSLTSPIAKIHVPAFNYSPMSFPEDTYVVVLSEMSPPKTFVVKVSVDSVNVTYSLKTNPDSSKFKIHPKSGVIVTRETFDYEGQKRYEFDVLANEGEAEAHVVVEIADENDNSPEFTLTSYLATVDENSPVGSNIAKIEATDKDDGKNGFVTYAIANADNLPFAIDPFTGVVSTTEHLDYELMRRWYHLRVWASDSGEPFSRVTECAATITLNNVNDNVPLFERVGCNVTVPPDLAAGRTVVELSAVDLDELQQLRYVIESGDELQIFAINSVSGEITLKQAIPPGVHSFDLRVVASDGEHRSEASVVRVTVTGRGDELTIICYETYIFKQLTEKLIESIKPIWTDNEDESFSDIHITNRHSPKFDSDIPSSLDFPEDHPLNTTVLHLDVVDHDTGFNGMVAYAISSGNEDGCFTVDTFSGDLRLVCPLDRETKQFYVLNITAYDQGAPQRSAWKFLAVNVLDVNDNPPLFDRPRCVIRVPENLNVDSVIFTAHATDLDADVSGNVRYTLLTSTVMFRIEEVTGKVVITAPLDREISPRHDLWIEARDQSKLSPPLFSTLHLVVVLQDVNDNPPIFLTKVYRVKVPEDVPVGTLLVWVESMDSDLGGGGIVTYNLKNTESGIFRLESSTGALTLERELDFERRPSYNLTVRAVDHGLPRSLSSSCFVEIQVLDVNENLHRPVFSDFVYEAVVMEDASVGTVVLTVTASDKDVGRDGVIRYRIHDGSGLGVFAIDEETGVVRSACPLDREKVPRYWLAVVATDLGTEPRASWAHVYVDVLDVNDNPPELSRPVYFAAVPENVDAVTSVVAVVASDADASSQGRLSFHMTESHRTYFAVDHQTGVISTVTALDREEKAEHSIEVIVSDNGSPPLRSTATAVVRVLDDNDNRPKFTDKLFHVKLPAQRRRDGRLEVCRVTACDDDEGSNADVTYELQDDHDGSFQIDPLTGVVTSLGDFWPGNYTILTIKATDAGGPPLSSAARLDVEWASPEPPSAEPLAFDEPHFTFAVMETEPVTHMVGIIMTETYRLRWFRIVGGDEEKDFDIQRNSGTISIARRLDAARRSNYNLTVQVTDGHHSATVQAYIRVLDINEHRPVFLKSRYEVRVPEDTPAWKDILHVAARDADANGKLIFSIHSSLDPHSHKLFHLDPKSGVLATTDKLDYETIPLHTLVVMVRDQEIPVKRNFAKVMVHVEDCNDHAPTFLSTRYEAAVSDVAPAGSEVVRVKALDGDVGSNADIVYSLHSGNINSIFSIDRVLGSISVSKPTDLQHQDPFHLTVKATDQGFPQRSDICSVHVHVRISDYTPPVFHDEEYLAEISELSSLGSHVVTVSAFSPAPVHYGIESGNPNGTFYIDRYTGLITIRKLLDFETCAYHTLKVLASTSSGAVSKAAVYIYVMDENDNPPTFARGEYTGHISEAAHVNSLVTSEENMPLVVEASDADRDANALLVYEILEKEAQKMFRIDPSTGAISLVAPLDFEGVTEYRFSVHVRDSGKPIFYAAQPVQVTVHVLDVNDYPPQFTAASFESSVIFPPVPGTEVTRVAAHDADSAVSYSITEGNLHSTFSIHPTTGVIAVSNVSTFKPFYQLLVTASDDLHRHSAVVRVNMINVTKSDLKFQQNTYSVSVSENLNGVKTLAALKPIGCYLNEPLSYSVLNPMGKFAISRTSGVMETTGVAFDREDTDAYDVVVMLQDVRTPPRTATALVKVFIDDVNDNAPVFLNLPFSMTISEDTEPGDVLYQATARDRDLGENGSIIYSLEDDYDFFRIDPDIGDISLQRPLDFDALSKYVLTVLAADEGDPGYMTEGQLSIQVRNRTNPVFQTLLYPLKVPETVPPFTTILHVQARNPEGYHLIYNLVEENSSKHFHIDFKTGALTVTNPLDFESQTLHVLTVRATDSVSGAFSEASIEVEVEDMNDNAPFFSQQKYNAVIAEGLPVGSSVLQLSAFDLDSGRNKEFTFHVLRTEGNESDFFDVDRRSGLIFTKQVLDHESTNHFQLKLQVVDNGSVALSSEAAVLVTVTDVNDNPPDFVSSHFQASLDESAKCGHIVIKIQASDPDVVDANRLKYKILSGNDGRYFNINESSGIISFANICKRNLDPYYNLTVAVSDGVFQKSAPINIDMISSNRHSPYFRQSTYEAELTENAEAGTRVIRLAAIDPDDGPYGSVDYTIINKLADEKFAIDAHGQIVTTQPLDRENPDQRVIAIKVMAKDGGGKVAFCTVKIILADDNDNVPQFKTSEYHVAIQSTVNKGSPVIQIMAYDADDGKNADITYTVDEGTGATEDIIEINPFTGVVSVKESLLGMENRIFNFKVQARDGSLPFYNSTVPLQVKVLPPEIPLPKFVEPLYTFSAAEDTPVGTEIGSVKADSNLPLIYSLVDGNTVESNRDKVFSLDKESGTLLLEKTVDHERTKWYHIDVLAQGNHNGTDVASLVSVSIQVQDVNDNQPVFDANPYRAYLAENMPAGTTVIQVTANDPDTDTNGLVTYSLESLPDDGANITDLFSIDGDTGWIVTVREADCEASRLHRFHVLATDHGGDAKLSSSVLVEVTVTDENDSPPAFSEDAYRGSVAENSRPGEVIVSMTTTDEDVSLENRLVTCYITDGDRLGQFAVIHRDEGEWGLIAKEPLDREANAAYALTITATDGKFQTPVGVRVDVLDYNDNAPQCQQLMYSEDLMENSPSSTFVLKVSASDADEGPNAQISFSLHGPDSDQFHLDHVTGELFTLAALDREVMSEYKMVARATDGGGLSCQADILVRVLDMNDNAPLFSSVHYRVSVYDNTTKGTPISAVYAHDIDAGVNSEVRYSLLEGDGGYFSLDEFSGILRLERTIGPDAPQRFQLKVKASDGGPLRPLHSVAALTVDVVSLNDYRPVFPDAEYAARVPESLAVGSRVLSVSALDVDASVKYRIASGNEDGHFLLDSKTGVLTLAAPLDFEASREFYLSVEGSRGRSSLADVAVVVVAVSDVNDNAPVFGRGDYSAEISEDRVPGSLVIKVTASDRDGPPSNNLLRFSIVSGDPLRQFAIDPRSGEISVCAGLDREERPHYSLTVQAADEGDPPLSSAVLVTITVADANDNPPVFSRVRHNLVLQEGEAAGSGILQLLVTDKDTPRNGPPFSFHIVSGNEERRFHVDQGGLLSLSAPLRRTSRAQHRLKIQVTDSGHPPLSSICAVTINVTEQSKYPPSVVPLEVFITTPGGLFANRLIGRLHASDQDPQDTLAFTLVSEDPVGHRFFVDRADGKIWTAENLEEGSYVLNVSVTDSRFIVWTAVKVHVWAATQGALDSGLTLRMAGISPEEFLADHWRGLQRSLAQALSFPRQELHLASLQMLHDAPNLEVLLVWRPQSGLVRPLPTNKLAGILTDVEDSLGLDVIQLSHNGCLGTGCPPRRCRNAIHLPGDTISHFSTARLAYITPRHRWESVCPCNESALRFRDEGYLKYIHGMDEDRQDFTVSLSFRTFQEDGLLMMVNGTDWGSLEVSGGHLHFSFSCGGPPTSRLAPASPAVSDGRWHRVLLEVSAASLRLTLDRRPPASADLPSPCRMMRSGGVLLFAGRRFRGCVEHAELDGEPIGAGNASEWSGLGRRRVFGVYECCGGGGPCDDKPCRNGGTCHQDESGAFRCRCPGSFHGARCEREDDPCASQPCARGRVCVPEGRGYTCNCSTEHPDARCQDGVDVCSPDPCPGGFLCRDSSGSFHCDPLPQVSAAVGYVEMMEIGGGVLGLLLLVAVFVCGRKRYVRRKNRKTENDANSSSSKSPKSRDWDGGRTELSCMASSADDLDRSPFRSLRPGEKSQGPAVCSVAPNLPARPPSGSDDDSVKKTRWDLDYEVYPADPDYFGRPVAAAQEFPQFDIVEDVYSSSAASDSRRNSRFGGFPFPLERADRRAPLPPCYANRNLDRFLDPDGVPLPRSRCPDAYAVTGYYPAKRAGGQDGDAAGYRRLSVRLAVSGSPYSERAGTPPNVARPQTRPSGTDERSYDGGSLLESDCGSCEEVMF